MHAFGLQGVFVLFLASRVGLVCSGTRLCSCSSTWAKTAGGFGLPPVRPVSNAQVSVSEGLPRCAGRLATEDTRAVGRAPHLH